MDGESGWWTTSGNIGLRPLARVMGEGSQQQQHGDTDESTDNQRNILKIQHLTDDSVNIIVWSNIKQNMLKWGN